MLSNITWSEFMGGVLILLIFYYLFIGAKYYREEIKSLLRGKLPKKTGAAKDVPQTANESFIDSTSFDELEAVVNDLRYAILEKAGKSISKEELLSKLQERLAKYKGLQKQAYRVAINNFIITHANEICGVMFNEHELNSAWDKLSQ